MNLSKSLWKGSSLFPLRISLDGFFFERHKMASWELLFMNTAPESSEKRACSLILNELPGVRRIVFSFAAPHKKNIVFFYFICVASFVSHRVILFLFTRKERKKTCNISIKCWCSLWNFDRDLVTVTPHLIILFMLQHSGCSTESFIIYFFVCVCFWMTASPLRKLGLWCSSMKLSNGLSGEEEKKDSLPKVALYLLYCNVTLFVTIFSPLFKTLLIRPYLH